MLKILRKNMKVIMWVLITAFVLWGAGTAITSRGRGPNYAGVMYGKKVSFDQYAKAWNEAKIQAMMIYGEEFFDAAQTLDLDNEAWNRLILIREAKKLGFKVTDKEVVEAIADISLFKRGDQFDEAAYNRIVRDYFRVTPRDFEEAIRDSLLITKLQQQILSGITLTPEEIKEEYKRSHEKAKASYVLFQPEEFIETIEVDEKDIQGYYAGNKQNFKKPLQVDIEYLFVSSENEKLADDIFYWLMDNPDLRKAGEEFDIPLQSTGFFAQEDQIPGVGWSSEFSVAAFSMDKGQVSDLIKTSKGFYLLTLKDKKEPYVQPLEEVKIEVEEALISQKAEDSAKEKAENALETIKEKMYAGSSFESAASQLGLKVIQTDYFTQAGYIKDIGEAGQFGKAAFDLETGKISGVVPVAKGFVILKLDERLPVTEEAFNEEKEEFEKDLLKQKRIQTYTIWLLTLRQQAALKSNIENLKRRR